VRPAALSLSFVSPKESKQRKGDPAVCDPQLCCGQPELRRFDGEPLELAALRQSRFFFPPNRRNSGAYRRGQRHARIHRRGASASSAGLGWADQGTRLSERGEFERHPAQTEQRSEPAHRAGDAFGSPFFWVLFFGEAKKSASPAGARPGQRTQQ